APPVSDEYRVRMPTRPRGDGSRGDGSRGDGSRGDGSRGDGSRGDGSRGDGSRGDGSRRLRIDEVGDCLLVSAGRTRRRGSVVARALPAEEGRVAVVVPDAVTPHIPELVQRLWQWVPVVWESVRLVMAYAASPDGDGRPPAQQMSEALGVEVIAPSGRLLAV